MYGTKRLAELADRVLEAVEDFVFEIQQKNTQTSHVPAAWMGTVAGIIVSISMLSMILVVKGA